MTEANPARTLRQRAGRLVLAAAMLGGILAMLQGCSAPEVDDPGIPPVLRWGGDSSGGEPYIVLREGAQPDGFEGELARYLAEQLGIRSQFVHKNWDSLPADLARGDVDVVLNGYEWSAERGQVMAASLPYYAYRLRLIVRKDSPIQDWSDLKPGMRVGVLKDSASERYLEAKYPGVQIEARDTEGTTGVMTAVVARNLDATIQDGPAAAWYLERKNEFPALHIVGEPVAPVAHSYYVIYTRPEQRQLRAQIDEALRAGLRDGSLRKIYARYGLWDADQTTLSQAMSDWPPPEAAVRPPLTVFLRMLFWAALITVQLASLAMPLAIVGGVLLAVGRLYGPRWLALPLTAYVEVTRGTPVLLQLAVIYYFLPTLGLTLSAFWASVIGLGGNYAAYEAENYRAGLLAIPRGQLEAALALGMSRWAALRRILLPQAIRLVIPPVTNDFISLFKDTSVCSAVGVIELTGMYRSLAVRHPGVVLQIGLLTALLYLAMSYPLALLARRMEKQQQKVEG